MNKRAIISTLVACWLMLCSALATAQDANADLYDAVAPADSAFIRVLNLSDISIEVGLTSKTLTQRVPVGQFSGYRFVPPGTHRITIGEQSLETELKANTASTVIYRDGQLQLLDDAFVNEPRRAQIAFYNLTGMQAALKTADGQHVVVETLGQNQTGSRMVNEVKIGFAAYEGERLLVNYEEQLLRKGRSYSYALMPDASGFRAVMLANSIDPTE
ncbi:MAG: alginate O-acetyltransferase [Gammaproteobacteria bacterium HGW-Gammaproteobacteria-11]|nr:MAG: alginate O-acetyltransferase [Gammaproteobacteria bacterium HGW-Gammaproteobacteria-11]